MAVEPLARGTLPQRQLSRAGVIGIAVAALIVASGTTLRIVDARHLKTWTDSQAIPTVAVIGPTKAAQGAALDLPGRLEAYKSAPIFARVSGYLKSWSVDIGTPVKAGQLLAEIETPELDQQLLQVKGDLASAAANAALASTTMSRWQALLGSDSVSRQEVDERTADFVAKQALVAAAKANVERLVATKSFARIVAPFDGVVTARDTDVGALINAGGGSGPVLFTIADVSRLRVYVHVPQNDAPTVKPGDVARLTVPEYPDQHFDAKVVGTANAVKGESGTTLVQLQVDNPGNKLMPGGFANMHFRLPVSADALRIPASALVFDSRGLRVATVGAGDRVAFRFVTIAQDFGNSVEIGSGLSASDRVVDTPPYGLADGDTVQIAHPAAKANAHG
jgi:RND family efflux transporter MFP subunit